MTDGAARMLPNVGTRTQDPTRQKWDNPIPMSCGHYMTRAAGGWLGLNARDCGADAFYVYVREGEAIAFRCFTHKEAL